MDADGEQLGLTVGTVLSLSLEPPLVGVSVARQAAMHELLRGAGAFGLSLLAGDQEAIAQIVAARFRIDEVSVPTRYFPEASSASFVDSCRYGLGILWLVFRYALHTHNLGTHNQFQSLRRRYTKVERISEQTGR